MKMLAQEIFVLLQYQDLFHFDRGGRRTGFVQSLDSIDLFFYPTLEEELGVVRGIVATETSQPGYIHVTYSLGVNLHGDATRELALRVGWDRVAKLVHIERQVSKQYEESVNENDLKKKQTSSPSKSYAVSYSHEKKTIMKTSSDTSMDA
jgi:hypothetical protein